MLIIGCGSLGSPIVELLARAGVGNLDIVDSERFDSPNVTPTALRMPGKARHSLQNGSSPCLMANAPRQLCGAG
ncbi:hypothetical protein GSY71_00715 [Pusillimonas sp. TS35]|nr:hypothetical protein [Pusillimonas sp. TS35]